MVITLKLLTLATISTTRIDKVMLSFYQSILSIIFVIDFDKIISNNKNATMIKYLYFCMK